MIHLVASVDLCNLSILIDNLREANVITHDYQAAEGIFLISILVRGRGFLHQTVRMLLITFLLRGTTVHWRLHELCLVVGAVWTPIAHD